jgi:mono/diheme cytochrome c family protein
MRVAVLSALSCCALGACDWSLQRMMDQPRCEVDEPSALFADGSCNQVPPEGTVRWRPTAVETTSASAAESRLPTREVVLHGRDRYDIFCAPCHGLLGDGVSQVAENMVLRRPPSLFEPRLVESPDAHYLDVVREGYGLMPSYGHALSAGDREAVVAYIRVLQRSQDVRLDELSPEQREEARSWLR